MNKTKLKLHNGMILTVTIEKEDEEFLEGLDLYNDPIKVEKKDIATRFTIHEGGNNGN